MCLLNEVDSSVSNCLILLILTSLHQSFMEESEREGGVMRNSGSLSVRNRNGFYNFSTILLRDTSIYKQSTVACFLLCHGKNESSSHFSVL